MQSATSEDLGEKIDSVLSKLDMLNLLQLSSNGAAVNLKLLREVDEKREALDAPPLTDIGACGIHTIHCSFKNGMVASDMKVGKVLKWMHYLLADCHHVVNVMKR